jgi:hypothetical protein
MATCPSTSTFTFDSFRGSRSRLLESGMTIPFAWAPMEIRINRKRARVVFIFLKV